MSAPWRSSSLKIPGLPTARFSGSPWSVSMLAMAGSAASRARVSGIIPRRRVWEMSYLAPAAMRSLKTSLLW